MRSDERDQHFAQPRPQGFSLKNLYLSPLLFWELTFFLEDFFLVSP